MLEIAIAALAVAVFSAVAGFRYGRCQAKAAERSAKASENSSDIAQRAITESYELWRRGQILEIVSDLIEQLTVYNQQAIDVIAYVNGKISHVITGVESGRIGEYRDRMYAAIQNGSHQRTRLGLIETRDDPLVVEATAVLHQANEAFLALAPVVGKRILNVDAETSAIKVFQTGFADLTRHAEERIATKRQSQLTLPTTPTPEQSPSAPPSDDK